MSTLSVSQHALLDSSWPTPPPLGHLSAYISAVNKMPILSLEEEQTCARALKNDNDLESAGKLVLSHLRLVVSVARQYLGFGLDHADLIQEGNVGLMKAVRRFDPEHGVRLASYAQHWIKAEIHEYILRNLRMVKVATTKAHRKLFNRLHSIKRRLHNEVNDGIYRQGLTASQIDAVAQELDVKRLDVVEMERRLAGGDVPLDPISDGDDETTQSAPIDYLTDSALEPSRVLESRQHDRLLSEGLERALELLDPRSRQIVQSRWLQVNDDGSGGSKLLELAAEYGLSAERIRQIEAAALKKMKATLTQGV